jgi:hypothetical protein
MAQSWRSANVLQNAICSAVERASCFEVDTRA